jgi:O-antigen/teichoic acid export membrane protein
MKKLGMRFSFRGLEFSLLKEMIAFTFFIFLNQIIDQVNWAVDKFLLVRMIGPATVAVYSVGAQINSLYIQMSTAVSSVFIPKVNQIVASSDDNRELTGLMARVGRIQYIILMLILTGFVFFGKSFIRLWTGAGTELAYYVALLLMVPVTVSLVQNLGIEIQRAKNMHKTRSVVYACLAVGNVGV